MSYIELDTWDKLKSSQPKGDHLAARVAFPEISSRLLAGIDAEEYRHFLIRLSENATELNDNQSRGISVSCKDLHVRNQLEESEAARYMDITCNDNTGHEAFDVIGREIAVSLNSSDISESEIVRNILAKWRRFWGQTPKNVLSLEEVVGLFAELWFLLNWILPNADQSDAISRWRGPFGSRHDFEWKGQSVEVKATMSTRGRIHWINGLDQLSPPEGGKLYLFSIRLREEEGATNTLPRLIASCHSALANNIEALTIFDDSLAKTGYSPLHDNEYEKIHLRVVDEVLFDVRDSFPRITTSTFQEGVPSGVEVVQYEINLEGYDTLIIAREPKVFKKLI
jgi:hypothetical protein